jgi:DNA-directed RNA polymerase specialized sigma subunit
MEWKQTYNDLCAEIDILQLRLVDLENEFKVAHRTVWTGCAPGENHARVPLDKSLMQYDEIKTKLQEVESTLRRKERIRDEMERRMSQFQGLEYKVAYMRDIQGKRLQQIADELGLSLLYIQKISSRVNRMRAS